MSASGIENTGAEAGAVNDVTTAMGNVTLDGNSDQAARDKTAAEAAAAAASISAAEGRRLYIGNLAYACSEEDLKEFFKGYLVETTSIPKNPRTDKAVGYAFIDLSTPTEAQRAIEELSGREILERKVSVQLAHKPDEAKGEESGDGTRRRSSGRRGRGGRGGRAAAGGGRGGAPGTAKEGGADDGADGANHGAAADAVEGHPLEDITNKAVAADKGANKTGKATRPPREPRELREPRESREPRPRGPPADGVASKTKVMVANLPYDLTEEHLKELFASYEPLSAKIALRPIPRFMIKKLQARNEPRKGRGFGFVTLASEEMQQKAVQEMNGRQIEGREIAVKIAIDSPDKIDDPAGGDDNHTEGDGKADAQAASNPAAEHAEAPAAVEPAAATA